MSMPLVTTHREKLTTLHKNLMRLHKVLLDDERAAYEKVNGTIATTGQVLNLVMYDPWFDWLHRISEAIVQIDQILESETATAEDAVSFLSDIRLLFRAEGNTSSFMTKYKAVLQRAPAAVLAHMEVQRNLLPDA